MADLNKFEEMLERLVNEDKEGAEELFHEIVVEKSRDIYESLLEADLEDEEVDEATDEEVDESDDEEVDEATDEEVDESDDEDLDEGFDLDEFEVEADPMDMDMGGDPADDMMGDMEPEAGDDEDDHHADVGGDEELEDRVMDLEDALEELKAEFDAMMDDEGDDEGDDEPEMGDDDEEAEEEAMAFESDDEEVEEATDEEVEETADEEVEESKAPLSAGEQMREYVEKVSATMGDNGANTKSAVAGKNDMGGTTANIARGDTASDPEAGAGSSVKGSALNGQNEKEDNAGNVNVPGGKAGKAATNGKKEPGHGAEKLGKPEAADNKKSVVGK